MLVVEERIGGPFNGVREIGREERGRDSLGEREREREIRGR